MASWWVALLSLGLAMGGAAVWRAIGWGDGGDGHEHARKLQRSSVPTVGGLAIFAAWCCLGLVQDPDTVTWGLPSWACDGSQPAGGFEHALVPWLALFAAILFGALDDWRRRGLRPRTKVVLQVLIGLFLASGSPFAACWLALAMLSSVHQNALNTFDNADGACLSIVAFGLFTCGSPLAPAVLVVLVPNLLLRNSEGDPLAYLGDGGSQLLGLAVLLTPGAWPVLVLPLLDLGAVSWRRMRRGIAPWKGDRRHLAHRLQRAGLSPLAVVLVLLAISGPSILAPEGRGLLGTVALFGLAWVGTRKVAEFQPHP
jgi:UDP-GlcNAc:undecaprenyl-phosphate GlcNAc-1-phosphate transferase